MLNFIMLTISLCCKENTTKKKLCDFNTSRIIIVFVQEIYFMFIYNSRFLEFPKAELLHQKYTVKKPPAEATRK